MRRSPRRTLRDAAIIGSPARGHPTSVLRVTKLCIFVGMTAGSYGFWALGDLAGFDFFGSFLLSGVGSVIGVYAGWKLAKKLES
jgi:uncharacterized membrane protein YfcA